MSNLWSRIAKLYDPITKKGHRFYRDMLGEMKQELSPSDRIAEIAVGTGTVTTAIAPSVSQVFACDLSQEMIQMAKKKVEGAGLSNVRFSVQDACNLDYPDAAFSVVVATAVLHIIPDPKKALAEIHRILRPDGILIAPTFVSGSTGLSRFLTLLMSVTGYRSYSKWTRESYLAFLEDNGFRVTNEIYYANSIPMEYTVAVKEANYE